MFARGIVAFAQSMTGKGSLVEPFFILRLGKLVTPGKPWRLASKWGWHGGTKDMSDAFFQYARRRARLES
jgi:hypothetical protein